MSKSRYKMPWGKHKGKSLSDVPFNYLRWLSEQDYSPKPVKVWVKKHKDFI